MDKETSDRFETVETSIKTINTNLEDLLFIFNGAKRGATLILLLGTVAKWLGGVSVAAISILALFKYIVTGVPPNISLD